MGTVTWSTILQPDGEIERFEGMIVPPPGAGGRVSYHYDYGPELVPLCPSEQSLWRYHALLPLADGPIHYPLHIGGTPLIAPPQLRRLTGLEKLWLKDETRGPTGSNKDRATGLVLEHAMRESIPTVTCASTGNVAVSLAVGAAAAGVCAVIFVPGAVSDAKLRIMLLAGAIVFKVLEGYDAAFQLSRQAVKAFGWYDRNTGVNPLTLEGKKTVAFEIWEQLGRRAPDVVVVPAGDGTTLSAMAKGFRELCECGVLERSPRIIGVQAEGAAPLYRAWKSGGALEIEPASTVADGIAVENPVSAVMAIRDVRETGGAFVRVPDGALLGAIGILASHGGVVPEPAAAAGFAALAPSLEAGLISVDEEVVVLITGSGLKTPQYLEPATAAFTISSNLQAVQEAMASR